MILSSLENFYSSPEEGNLGVVYIQINFFLALRLTPKR